MTELKIEELTIGQKLGMCLCAHLNRGMKDVEDALEMIRNHGLGAVWVDPEQKDRDEIIRRVREAADYPILILCDAEKGAGDCKIPQVVSITAAGAKNAYARSFGRATGTILRKIGYNVVCNPLLDMCHGNKPCDGVTRTFGSDRETCARLGCEVARGMHEGGVLSVSKHYPGNGTLQYDTHMRESFINLTKEELLGDNLYPYLALMKEGLLDGIMTGHKAVLTIDPDNPASLSRGVLDVLREQGFEGFYITDALCMLGIQLRYGYPRAHGQCIQAGNSLALSWEIPVKEAYDCMKWSWENGIMSEKDIDEAVGYTLKAQHKVTLLPCPDAVSEEDRENIRRISRECVAAVCGEGCTPDIPREGKHLFVITTTGYVSQTVGSDGLGELKDWYQPEKIAALLKEKFPNSDTWEMPCYPSPGDMWRFFPVQEKYDDLVFVTYFQSGACVGREHFTYPLIDLMDAMQSTDRISAQLYFGNPFVMEDVPYVPRRIMGLASAQCIEDAISVLAGEAEPVGQVPYPIRLHKKGDILAES